jgi:GNAT superfamily N-acetyltransferase
MGFELIKVETREDLERFVRLPWKIYKDPSYWVPPLIQERKKFLNPEINPFFEHAEVDLFLALDSDRAPVGRIALIHDRNYQGLHSEAVGMFGMFESIDDPSVSRQLLDKANQWCQERGLTRLMGPMNLSTNHECGLLVEGFDSPTMFGIPYNPEYYGKHFESWGLKKAKDLLAFRLDLVKIPDYLEKAALKLKRRNRFNIRCLDLSRFEKEISILWDIYNSAWDLNWGFIPMTQKEFEFSAREMKAIIQPEFCMIAEVKGEPVGFSLALPDVNQVLKKLDGSLFPFGWAQFLWQKNKIDAYRVLTLGVKKNYRRLGIDAWFYYETYRLFMEKKIKWIEMSWLLEDNKGIVDPMHRIGGEIYKRHRIYERSITS